MVWLFYFVENISVMRKTILALSILSIQIVNGQAPIQESFKLAWKIIPAYTNINAYRPNPFVPLNYRDSRVEVSPSEQAMLVNFKKNENGVILITEGLSVRWQTPIQGNLFAINKVNGNLVVIHNGSSEVRNEGYSLVLATVLDPATGKKIITKDLLGGKPDHYVDAHVFSDPEQKEIIIGFRHSAGIIKQKSKSVASFGREGYEITERYEVVSFNENLEQLKKTVLPIKKSSTLYEVQMSINKNFILSYEESPGTFGLQVISGESQIWYKSHVFASKADAYDRYKIIPSNIFPEVFYFASNFQNTEKDPVLSLVRIDYSNQDVKRFERVFTKDYKKELIEKWESSDNGKDSRPIPKFWDYFKVSSLVELQDRFIVIAESMHTEIYETMSTNASGSGFSSRSYAYNQNNDMLLTVFGNDLKILDEKLVGKKNKYTSTIGNFAGVLLKDNFLYIVTATNEKIASYRPLVMKYDINAKTFVYQKITDRGTLKTMRRVSPPSTIWFKKGFAIVFWDGDETFLNSSVNTDLQFFSY